MNDRALYDEEILDALPTKELLRLDKRFRAKPSWAALAHLFVQLERLVQRAATETSQVSPPLEVERAHALLLRCYRGIVADSDAVAKRVRARGSFPVNDQFSYLSPQTHTVCQSASDDYTKHRYKSAAVADFGRGI